jgi:hypothetical protein
VTTPYQAAEGLAGAVSNVVRCTPHRTSSVNPPCAMVVRKEFDPRLVMSDRKAVYQFDVVVFANASTDRPPHKKLEAFAAVEGNDSIRAAVEDDTNWSVDIDYAAVTLIGEVALITYANEEYWVLPISVEVCF